MSVLSRDEILKCIDSGEIAISPFNKEAIGCASIDLTLSNEFRIFSTDVKTPLKVVESTNYKDVTTKFSLKEGETYILEPGQTCLGITQETIKLSPRYCGLLEGRSRFARLGLFIHISASLMNPGINNRQVLEIFNASPNRLELVPGTKICQFIFLKVQGEATYIGRFKDNDL